MSMPFYSPGNPFGGSYMRGIGPGSEVRGKLTWGQLNAQQYTGNRAGIGPVSYSREAPMHYAPGTSGLAGGKDKEKNTTLRDMAIGGAIGYVAGRRPGDGEAPPVVAGRPSPSFPPAGALTETTGEPRALPPGGRAPVGHTNRALQHGPPPTQRSVRSIEEQLPIRQPVAGQQVFDLHSSAASTQPQQQRRRRTY